MYLPIASLVTALPAAAGFSVASLVPATTASILAFVSFWSREAPSCGFIFGSGLLFSSSIIFINSLRDFAASSSSLNFSFFLCPAPISPPRTSEPTGVPTVSGIPSAALSNLLIVGLSSPIANGLAATPSVVVLGIDGDIDSGNSEACCEPEVIPTIASCLCCGVSCGVIS